MSIKDINNIALTKPWKGNSNGSIVVLIPKKIAEKSHLSTDSYVAIQGEDDGLVIINKINMGALTEVV